MWFARECLIRKAEGYLRRDEPVPLDLVAKLNDVGVILADLDRGR